MPGEQKLNFQFIPQQKTINARVAEWLGGGLQNLLQRFESVSGVKAQVL